MKEILVINLLNAVHLEIFSPLFWLPSFFVYLLISIRSLGKKNTLKAHAVEIANYMRKACLQVKPHEMHVAVKV